MKVRRNECKGYLKYHKIQTQNIPFSGFVCESNGAHTQREEERKYGGKAQLFVLIQA